MALHVERSADVYSVYLKYSPGDIHVYSIDEAFIGCNTVLVALWMYSKRVGRELQM